METPTPEKPKRKLTKKQRGFIKDYLETGNATEAVIKNYDVKDREVAKVIGSQNLTNLNVFTTIQEFLQEEDLAKKHKELLNANVIESVQFEKDVSDELIRDMIAKMPGYELLHIFERQSSSGEVWGKTAYVKAPDTNTQDKALDKAYKIKGTYAPEKTQNLNVNVDVYDPKVRDLADEYEKQLRNNFSNGEIT